MIVIDRKKISLFIVGITDSSTFLTFVHKIAEKQHIPTINKLIFFLSITIMQTFYRGDDEKGKRLAECVQDAIYESTKVDNHRKAHDISGVYLIEHVEIPINFLTYSISLIYNLDSLFNYAELTKDIDPSLVMKPEIEIQTTCFITTSNKTHHIIVQSLIKAGCFEQMGMNQKTLIYNLDLIINYGENTHSWSV